MKKEMASFKETLEKVQEQIIINDQKQINRLQNELKILNSKVLYINELVKPHMK